MREKAKSSIINKLEMNNFAKMYSVNNTLIACYDIDIYEFSSLRNSKLIRLFLLVSEFLRHAPCMQKVQPQYESCYKKYQRITQDIESGNQIANPNEPLKPLCW